MAPSIARPLPAAAGDGAAPISRRAPMMCELDHTPRDFVILKIKWRRNLNNKWRTWDRPRCVGAPLVRFLVRQSCCPVWRPSPGLPDIFKVTAHRSFDGHAEQALTPLGCVRQIILKILRHLIFKMTGAGCR